MCSDAFVFISVALFLSHPRRCKNNFSLSSLVYVCFQIPFFPSSQTQFYTFIGSITEEPNPDNLIWVNLLLLLSKAENSWLRFIGRNFHQFAEPVFNFRLILSSKIDHNNEFCIIFCTDVDNEQQQQRDYELFICSHTFLFSLPL